MLAYETSFANFHDRLAIAWHGGDVAHDAIYLRLTDAHARPEESLLALTDGMRHAYEPDVQVFGDSLLVAWYEKDDKGALTAMLGCFAPNGTRRWQIALSGSAYQGRNPVVRTWNNEILVAWLQAPRITEGTPASNEVWATRLDAQGVLLQPALKAGDASTDTWNLNAAVDDRGVFHVVYDAQLEQRAHELQALEIGLEGSAHYTLSDDDGHASLYPDIAIAGEQVAVTWFDQRDGHPQVYLHVGTLADLHGPFAADKQLRVTHSPGAATGAYVAWNAARVGLAWCDDSGGTTQVYAQQFDARGSPLQPIQQLTHTAAQAFIPAIHPWGDGFALTWNEYLGIRQTAGHSATRSSVARLAILSAP
ncbi:MAG: hypothetical protein QM718_15055 [Steroidobacteraceae bacterium]